jgi:hypothetical protein
MHDGKSDSKVQRHFLLSKSIFSKPLTQSHYPGYNSELVKFSSHNHITIFNTVFNNILPYLGLLNDRRQDFPLCNDWISKHFTFLAKNVVHRNLLDLTNLLILRGAAVVQSV